MWILVKGSCALPDTTLPWLCIPTVEFEVLIVPADRRYARLRNSTIRVNHSRSQRVKPCCCGLMVSVKRVEYRPRQSVLMSTVRTITHAGRGQLSRASGGRHEPQRYCRGLYTDVMAFSTDVENSDDITILAIQYLGPRAK
jgi:hypothetical protein